KWDPAQTVEGQLEPAAAERPAGAGGAGATPDYELSGQDHHKGAGGGRPRPAHGSDALVLKSLSPSVGSSGWGKRGPGGGDGNRTQERHGGGEVGKHDLRRELEQDGDAAQRHLHAEQASRHGRRGEQVPALA